MAQTPEERKAVKGRYRESHLDQERESGRKYRETHREQLRETQRKWAELHPEKLKVVARKAQRKYNVAHPEARRKAHCKRRYGIADGGEQLLAEQNGVCAICRNIRGRKTLNVDHNHVAGQVRGLLCHKCNLALGHMEDNPQWLRQAAEYLESHN